MKTMKITNKILAFVAAFALATPLLTSCEDDPTGSDLFPFRDDSKTSNLMMSEYLKSKPEYSDFAAIIQKAGLMDLLSVYGTFTCFAPSNTAVQAYLKTKGRASVNDLTALECDTIARTHLVSTKAYSTYDIGTSVTNMRRRQLDAVAAEDSEGNAVIKLNDTATILFKTQNDSVQNGIVQGIDAVLENSMKTVPALIKQNPRLKLYYYALEKTGLAEQMEKIQDPNYVQDDYQYRYKSGAEPWEIAIAPESKLYGFTAFVVPDDVLKSKGYITTDPNDNLDQALQELFVTAKAIYDQTYPADAAAYPAYDASKLTEEKNPLYRFMAYHVIPRKPQEKVQLTVRNDQGIFTNVMNPTEWYETMLPYTMLKVMKYTVNVSAYGTVAKTIGEGTAVEDAFWLNRCFDKYHATAADEGSQIHLNVESGVVNNAVNGFYFYADDIIAFSKHTRDVVDNARMRIDMSALFPEMMTNNHRMNGSIEGTGDNIIDKVNNKGYNYWYPNGYLTGVTNSSSDGYLVYRRPRTGYWSYNGDEMIVQGVFDVSFRLPPVPTAGMYQVRMGYAAMEGRRSIAQFYFGEDPVPQNVVGVPVDMDVQMNNAALLGANFTLKYTDANSKSYEGYSAVRKVAYPTDGSEGDEAAKDLLSNDQKVLKNMGYYRGAWGCGCGPDVNDHSGKTPFADIANTFRIVLTEQYMEPGKYYYFRIRKATKIVRGNDECMMDYIEVVPKSVYGITDGEMKEDDL